MRATKTHHPDPTGDATRSGTLLGALQALYRAYQKSAIYPEGHPAVPAGVALAIVGLETAFGDRSHLLLGVARDQLLHEGTPIQEATGSIRSLALLLHQLDIAAIEFHRDLDAAELERFVRSLGHARRERVKGARLSAWLGERGVERVRVAPIDYRALSFADGAQTAGTTAGTHAEKWEQLSRVLTDPGSYARDDDVRALAEEVGEQIEAYEGAGVGELRRQLHAAVDGIREAPEDQRDVLRRRVGGFVAGLHPELRRDLLRVDPGSSSKHLHLLTDLAGELPSGDLLEALQEVDRLRARVPDEVVALLNKLARVSDQRPGLSGQLGRTLETWGIDPRTTDAGPDVKGALQEIFQRRSDEDYNPGAYRELLGDLSRNLDSGLAARDSTRRYRSATDPADRRLHAAELAVELLERQDGEDYRASLMAYVSSSCEFLLEQQRFDTVHEATIAARAHLALNAESDATRRAARCFLDEFATEKRVTEILHHACNTEEMPADALSLLGLGGATALDAVLDRLIENPSPGVTTALKRFARERGPEMLERIIDHRAARGHRALEPVFALIREFPTADAVSISERLKEHEDYRVRRDALFLLIEIDDRSGAQERHLRRALGDASERIRGQAMRTLRRLCSPGTTELIARYIEGRLPGKRPQAGLVRQAAAALLERDLTGGERLMGCLERLRRTVSPTALRTAKIVAAELHGRTELPGATRSVRRWRWSLNHLLGLLVADGHKPSRREIS